MGAQNQKLGIEEAGGVPAHPGVLGEAEEVTGRLSEEHFRRERQVAGGSWGMGGHLEQVGVRRFEDGAEGNAFDEGGPFRGAKDCRSLQRVNFTRWARRGVLANLAKLAIIGGTPPPRVFPPSSPDAMACSRNSLVSRIFRGT
jgi:hypothetical protein